MSVNELGARVARYLGSTKNLTGCALALVGVGITLAGRAGSYWPLVVAGLYGVGALAAPPDKVRLALTGPDTEAEARSLRADLATLARRVDAAGARLPEDARARVRLIIDVLGEIINRIEQLATSPEQRFVVARTIRDYLPTSLETYLNLPRSYALTRRLGGGRRTAHEELLAQLDLLEGKLREIADAVYSGDAQALVDQGRFLEDRFRRSELDL
jgi:hypothetical protein